jgi:hypothetical protein
MKMVAMQKQKMRKVAIVHFVLTLVIFLVVLTIPISRLTTDYIYIVFSDFVIQFFYFLQPIFCYGMENQTIILTAWSALMIATVPFWSICFAWLFIKLDNWLNHFPVLGKKVFSNHKS